jgi:hypothetical protein
MSHHHKQPLSFFNSCISFLFILSLFLWVKSQSTLLGSLFRVSHR